jgi:hypothetical protein
VQVHRAVDGAVQALENSAQIREKQKVCQLTSNSQSRFACTAYCNLLANGKNDADSALLVKRRRPLRNLWLTEVPSLNRACAFL